MATLPQSQCLSPGQQRQAEPGPACAVALPPGWLLPRMVRRRRRRLIPAINSSAASVRALTAARLTEFSSVRGALLTESGNVGQARARARGGGGPRARPLHLAELCDNRAAKEGSCAKPGSVM